MYLCPVCGATNPKEEECKPPEPKREKCGNPMHEGSVVKCDRLMGHESDCSFTGTSGRAASEKCGHGARGEARLKSCACQNDFAPAQPVPAAQGEKCGCTTFVGVHQLDSSACEIKEVVGGRDWLQEQCVLKDAALEAAREEIAHCREGWKIATDEACRSHSTIAALRAALDYLESKIDGYEVVFGVALGIATGRLCCGFHSQKKNDCAALADQPDARTTEERK